MHRTMRKFRLDGPGVLFNTDGEGGGGTPPAPPVEGAPPADDKGFPDGTPVAEMTIEQQAAYWRTQARKHEDRVKAVGLTPEQVKELRDKATKHDALERELMSDKDKAVAEARETARREARAELVPSLVAAEFRAAAGNRIEPARLATILEPLDLSKFLTDTGEVDTDKVTAFVNGVAPGTGTGLQQPPRGPSPSGQGRRDSSAQPSVASGRERYAQRHGKK
jgi:hypothetical protein